MNGVIKDDAIKTGEQLEKCLCIHAEAIAIAEFKGVSGFNSISQENLDLLESFL
jgi:hypothetical protein